MIDRMRSFGRTHDQIRPVKVLVDPYGYAAASILLELGNTKVLCAVDMQQGVPPFLRGKKVGWLKAEYNMLPASTPTRFARESSACVKNGRLVEISRLIGRSLRSILDLTVIGERTITIDCEVLQADGGTRTACITGASLALWYAAERWKASGEVTGTLVRDQIAAVSVGIRNDMVLLDLDCAEDNAIDADFNFVLTKSGSIVEIQGTAENKTVSWPHFTQMCTLATKGIDDFFQQLAGHHAHALSENNDKQLLHHKKVPLFSLANRIAGKRNDDGPLNVPQ